MAFDYKLKKFTEIGELSPAAAHGYWRTMFSPVELRSVLRKDVFAELSTHTSLYERTFDGLNEDMDRPSIIGLLKADMLAWLQPMLPWADNMSMAHSVELRFPLLDHRLLEFAYSLSERHVFRGWSLKRIMRRMLKSRLPREVLSRGKRGTHLPIGRWLNADLAPVADEYLSPQRLRDQRLFDQGTVKQLVADHRSGRRDNTFKLWNLIVFSAWLEHNQIVTI